MKLNKFKFAIASAVLVWGGLTTSCDTLDIKNLESYDESMVWGDVNLATAYVNNLYAITLATGLIRPTTTPIRSQVCPGI